MPDTSMAPMWLGPRNCTGGKAKWDAPGCLEAREAERMCDEYYDERVRALWRALAEKEGLVILPTETAEEGTVAVKPLVLESETPTKPKPRAMTR